MLGLAGPILAMLEPFYFALLAVLVTWFFQRLVGQIADAVSRRYEGRGDGASNARITRVAVSRHVATFLIFIAGLGFALSRFTWFRQFGPTLLASAGVLGIVLGIAAQRVVGNLFAGLVLALTQPVKSGDAILFQDEFGWVEEIGLTFLVIRTWDMRRLVVPLSYLMDHPVQNWSRRSQQMMKPVYVYADYRVDVGAVREELGKILEESDDWDEEVPPILEVTDCSPTAIQLRALCSASDPGAAWRLHCQVREGLVAFLRHLESGDYLPRSRVALVGDAPGGPDREEEERREAVEARHGGPDHGHHPDEQTDGEGDGSK